MQFNPFATNRDAKPLQPIVVDTSNDAANLYRQQLEQRRLEIQQACDGIGLKSIMMGKVPLANISGQIVRLDDSLTFDGIDFKVTQITRVRVTLTAKDAKFNLVVDVDLGLELDR